MVYRKFVSAHRRMLGFGLLTAFSSSFGQTFFISLFLLHFLGAFSLDKAAFGVLYASATLLSALMLPVLGRKIDTARLRSYTVLVLAGLAASALLAATARHVLLLAVAIVGLRLFGQGLLGHISQTVMARDFARFRGRALGLAGLGYPLGEALLPIAFAALLLWVEWRTAWLAVAVAIAGVILPVALYLLRGGEPEESPPPAAGERAETGGAYWRDRRFWFVMPAALAAPFLFTGLFLYQVPLAASKGWRPEWIAAAFTGFAIARALSTVASGPVIDRFTALRLLPFYLLPLAVGMALLVGFSSPWIAFPYLMLVGVSAGTHSSILSAVWAEMFGSHAIGAVRSMASSLTVFATAASPALMGWLFVRGIGFDAMLAAGIVVALTACVVTLPVTPWTANIAKRGSWRRWSPSAAREAE